MKIFVTTVLSLIALFSLTTGLHGGLSSSHAPAVPLMFQTVTTTASPVQIGILTADPTTVFTNTPTVVTITSELTDPRVIPTSVNLQQVDAAGNPLSVLG